MVDPFEDISITRFEAGQQDSTHSGLVHFRFLLSQKAPPLWERLAGQRVNDRGWAWVIQRRGSVYSTMFVIVCTPEEAQRVKDQLNSEILPGINRDYRQAAREDQQRQDARNAHRYSVMSAAKKAVRDQK